MAEEKLSLVEYIGIIGILRQGGSGEQMYSALLARFGEDRLRTDAALFQAVERAVAGLVAEGDLEQKETAIARDVHLGWLLDTAKARATGVADVPVGDLEQSVSEAAEKHGVSVEYVRDVLARRT